MKFVCVNKCQYHGRIIKEGQIINVSEITQCKYCKGNGCDKCRKTGRSDPPHHFKPVEEDKPVTVVTEPEQKEDSDEIDNLRNEFEKRGIAFDRRWGAKKLKDELIKATKEGKTK